MLLLVIVGMAVSKERVAHLLGLAVGHLRLRRDCDAVLTMYAFPRCDSSKQSRRLRRRLDADAYQAIVVCVVSS